jgi:hypothetical protein
MDSAIKRIPGAGGKIPRLARAEQVILYLLDNLFLSQNVIEVSPFHGLIVEMPENPHKYF